MTLGEQQRLFARLVGQLIAWAYANGYELTLGEALRSAEQAEWNAEHGTGITKSLHILKLAIDLNLFRDGIFLTAKEDYQPLGDYWKSLHSLARWGGDFSRPDSDHFSLEWQGVK